MTCSLETTSSQSQNEHFYFFQNALEEKKIFEDRDVEQLCEKYPLNNRFCFINKRGKFSDCLLQILASKMPHIEEFSIDDSSWGASDFSTISLQAIKTFASSLTQLHTLRIKLCSDFHGYWNQSLVDFAGLSTQLSHV